MATVEKIVALPPLLRIVRTTLSGMARAGSVVALLLAWELLARTGVLTPFQLPALSAVLERIWSDGASGDLFINLSLTLYRALAGFFIAAAGGIVLGMAMSRSRHSICRFSG